MTPPATTTEIRMGSDISVFFISFRLKQLLMVIWILESLGLAQGFIECRDPGWFGPNCLYKCRCKSDSFCNPSGDCGGHCADDWFGPQCQFSAASLSVISEELDLKALVDNDPKTCAGRIRDGVVKVVDLKKFGWMRMKTDKFTDIKDVDVTINRLVKAGYEKICPNVDRVDAGNNTYDFRCLEHSPPYTSVFIKISTSHEAAVCSIWVSQGYNVALKQTVQLTSDQKDWSDSKVVDGVTGFSEGTFEVSDASLRRACVHATAKDDMINLKLTLDQEREVTLIRLHTGIDLTMDCCVSDMKNFEVIISSDSVKQKFYYEPSGHHVVHTIVPKPSTAHYIYIRANEVLSVCEIEVFTELKCKAERWGLKCDKKCHCNRNFSPCFPSTGLCSKGCHGGYKGIGCQTPCNRGSFGPGCTKKCSPKCKQGPMMCQTETGVCFDGCVKGYAPPNCDYEICHKHGFFGKDCMFKCHCVDGKDCDKVTGNCPSVYRKFTYHNCENGFIGPGCQYMRDIPDGSQKPTWLYDSWDTTCNTNQRATKVEKKIKRTKIAFVRIVVRDKRFLGPYQVILYGQSGSAWCKKDAYILVDANILDYACVSRRRITKMVVTGKNVWNICSLIGATGREHALRQRAETKSGKFYNGRPPGLAVDGHRSGSYYFRRRFTDSDTCFQSHERDVQDALIVHLPTLHFVSQVNLQYVQQCCWAWLYGFVANLSMDDELVYTYHDKNYFIDKKRVTKEFNVQIGVPLKPINKISIYGGLKEYMIICELQVFGERLCPSGRYGFRCEHTCNCRFGKNNCQVHSGGCIDGCRSGYKGYDCWTKCDVGTFGHGCKGRCSSNCEGGNKLCSESDGACYKGCIVGFKPPDCTQKCDIGWYGKDCKTKCSPGCGGTGTKHCDVFSGVCATLPCTAGYLGDACQEECNSTHFGLGCKQKCGFRCLGRKCNHVTGVCNDCPEGKTGDLCEVDVAEKLATHAQLAAAALAGIAGILLAIACILCCAEREKNDAEDMDKEGCTA